MEYFEGSGTKVLTFFFRLIEGDNTSSLDWDWAVDDPYSFIECPSNSTLSGLKYQCLVLNKNGDEVSLNTTHIPKMNSGIVVDTRKPVVTQIYSTKNTSSYPGEVRLVHGEDWWARRGMMRASH